MNIDYIELMKETPEEKEILDRIALKNTMFKESDAYKEHKKEIDAMYEEYSKIRQERLKKGKEERTARRSVHKILPLTDEQKEKIKEERERKENLLPQSIKELIDGFKTLSEKEKYEFLIKIRPYSPVYDIPKAENPQTTEKDIDELQILMVQTVIDFINDRGLKDIWSVSFNADDLQTSAEYGEWCPATDSHIAVEGIGKDETRELIGENW